MARTLARPVPAALLTAAVLHVLWVFTLAHSGGDLAAQDAWAEFAARHPGLAYNLSWFGGMHPVSYSVFTPYLMALLGVRTTMVVAGTVSAGLLALILVRSRAVRRPLAPALYGVAALTCNAISGRVTYGLGQMFALGAVAVVFAWPRRWRTGRRAHRLARGAAAALLAALATAASPVAGLFLWVVAGALLLTKRWTAAFALALPPAVVVGPAAWLFPFSGTQPMGFISAVQPVIVSVAVYLLVPVQWRTVRVGALVYAAGVLATWAIPSQVGTNVTRLGLFFGGIALIAALPDARRGARRWVALVLALVTATVWQGYKVGEDIVYMRPAAIWTHELTPLTDRLRALPDARQGRVEVVPVRSHREASALAPYVNLARGWNRQADVDRNPVFYDKSLSPATYHAWLKRWSVRYVVLASEAPDMAAVQEAELVAGGQPYLSEVWSDRHWKIFRVKDPVPLAEPPAMVARTDAGGLTVTVGKPGEVLIRVPYSPWLGLVDAHGRAVEPPRPGPDGAPAVNRDGCLTKAGPVPAGDGPGDRPADEWTFLRAPHAGTYRLAAPYRLPRGTACP
ncbi:MFS transporter [Streptomyces sp. MST-110588]|nr:MFS transporter [Streptomyces sp. MST-110588]